MVFLHAHRHAIIIVWLEVVGNAHRHAIIIDSTLWFGQSHLIQSSSCDSIVTRSVCSPKEDFGRLKNLSVFEALFEGPSILFGLLLIVEKRFENAVCNVCSAFQNLRWGSIQLGWTDKSSWYHKISTNTVTLSFNFCSPNRVLTYAPWKVLDLGYKSWKALRKRIFEMSNSKDDSMTMSPDHKMIYPTIAWRINDDVSPDHKMLNRVWPMWWTTFPMLTHAGLGKSINEDSIFEAYPHRIGQAQ